MSTASEPAPRHDSRFPGESPEYRRRRNELLEAELDLRRRIEDVAALRRRLPLGGPVPEDYRFHGLTDPSAPRSAREIRLSELFTQPQAPLVLYGFMFGPNMASPCPMCTSFLDSLDGAAPHLGQSVNLAVVASSPIERIVEFARSRGWRRLRLVSSAGTHFGRDYHAEAPNGSQVPIANVFVRRGGEIHHAYATEMVFAPEEPGQNARHIDLAWPLWNVLDWTPAGRGTDWYPKLSYER